MARLKINQCIEEIQWCFQICFPNVLQVLENNHFFLNFKPNLNLLFKIHSLQYFVNLVGKPIFLEFCAYAVKYFLKSTRICSKWKKYQSKQKPNLHSISEIISLFSHIYLRKNVAVPLGHYQIYATQPFATFSNKAVQRVQNTLLDYNILMHNVPIWLNTP